MNVKLQDILYEASKTERSKKLAKASEKLEKTISEGNWMLQDPILFRGKVVGPDDDIFTVKETTERKGTQDTSRIIDRIIHGFYEYCYPDYPNRRESRFATTEMRFASTFGPVVYVIIPHESANISSFYRDPVGIFNSLDDMVPEIAELIRSNPGDVNNLFSDLKYIAKAMLEMWMGRADYTTMEKFPCPSEIVQKINDDLERHIKEDIPNSLHRPMKKFFKEIESGYFDRVQLGYPEEGAKDVMFEGKYIQVEAEAFEITYGL